MKNKNKSNKKIKVMLTVIIFAVVLAVISALLIYFKPNFVKWGKTCYVIVCAVVGMDIGAFVASFFPQNYEVSECNVYYILDKKPISIQSGSDEITFFIDGGDGKTIPMNVKVNSVFIKHINGEDSKVEIIKYVRTNKFALGGPKVDVNILISDPHHWCGFFLIKKTCILLQV